MPMPGRSRKCKQSPHRLMKREDRDRGCHKSKYRSRTAADHPAPSNALPSPHAAQVVISCASGAILLFPPKGRRRSPILVAKQWSKAIASGVPQIVLVAASIRAA